MKYDKIINCFINDSDIKIDKYGVIRGNLNIEFTVDKEDSDLIKLLRLIEYNCNIGHSFICEVEGEKFFIDGDGKCRFNITKQEDREKIKAIIEGEI